MRFAVLVFPGSNCDYDAYHVVRQVLGERAEFIWHREASLDGFDVVIIPGGFSYGDYLRTGAIASLSPIMEAVRQFASAGGLVLGICNGFQILIEAGLLPGALISNSGLRFISRQIYLQPEGSGDPFTAGLDTGRSYAMPIAHQAGNYLVSPQELEQLEKNEQIAFRYVTAVGERTPDANPNGSSANIAGVLNREKNIMGMMPHPERAAEAVLGSVDGLALFESIIGRS
ncbi:MAG: phosphoribosylformylglycinamidine synthase subunit PurQ [Candidatus Marinimicrobia bacterium]|nr:phosphoribosylformylglycinamidine synthase subunit PurQ [Candidatus Neomarinimicrobiota bacterium]MCH8836466.1 phosphoribosylformylglycinamidine synthase subunit PurQ [Candidatus Neomarinimicrobiota bacterium]